MNGRTPYRIFKAGIKRQKPSSKDATEEVPDHTPSPAKGQVITVSVPPRRWSSFSDRCLGTTI